MVCTARFGVMTVIFCLYVRPMIGVNVSSNTEINISYIKISDDYDFSMAALGILFLF